MALLQLFCVVVQVVIMSLGEFPEQGRCKLFTSKVWGWVFLALARNIQIALSKEQKVISGCIRSIIVGLSRGQWRAIIAIVDGLTNHLHTLTLWKGHRTRWEWEGLGERCLWCFGKNMERRWGFCARCLCVCFCSEWIHVIGFGRLFFKCHESYIYMD